MLPPGFWGGTRSWYLKRCYAFHQHTHFIFRLQQGWNENQANEKQNKWLCWLFHSGCEGGTLSAFMLCAPMNQWPAVWGDWPGTVCNAQKWLRRTWVLSITALQCLSQLLGELWGWSWSDLVTTRLTKRDKMVKNEEPGMWHAPVSPATQGLKREDHLSPGNQGQPGQHRNFISIKNNNCVTRLGNN